jgi:hypothetical protein
LISRRRVLARSGDVTVGRDVALEGELFAAPFGEQGSGAFDTNVWALGGSGLYHLVREHFTPYSIAGIGVMVADVETKDIGGIEDDTSIAFASNSGGGLKTGTIESPRSAPERPVLQRR